ncbi:polysaccharide pyruvyl transferase family protein [Labilibacter sediminis]|nr:polysaccharide pyruvyl transferase family protein [Labilibacter sediminis]
MKIGIISFNKYSNHMNYGAVLHSYAFQQYLDSINIDSRIIDYIPKSLEKYNIKYPILNNRRFWSIFPFSRAVFRWSVGFKSNVRKYKKFENFFATHYKLTDKTYSHADLFEQTNCKDLEFSTVVCESDIIWKRKSTGGVYNEAFFLKFPMAENARKVAYAPSLGAKPFSEEEKVQFKELVSDFDAISTRESQGAAYLSKLLNTDISWVLDPTLLIESKDYSDIIIEPNEKNYLLVYNCMKNDKAMVKQAASLAKKMNLKLIEICAFPENRVYFNHEVKDDIGIEEFLGLFKNASYVVCNAFHGGCFSLLFEKQFFLFLRDATDYRMKNITDALDIGDRLIHFYNKVIPSDIKEIDYSIVNVKLNELRERSRSFIKENLE